jgi:hypothetical protein
MVESRKTALVLGVHSFMDNHVKVGIQYIAEGLSSLGWSVDYVSIFSSPFDLYGPQRRRRLKRVWIHRQDRHGIGVKPGLREYAFRAPVPGNKKVLRYGWQMGTFSALVPSWFKNKVYEVCVHDLTGNIVYLPLVKSHLRVLRLNDLPEGFSHALSSHIINRSKTYIRSNRYDEIWPAHEPLTRYALGLNPAGRVVTIPNGVDENFLSVAMDKVRKSKSAVFAGSVEQWVDLELLDKTAHLMPDWQFDVIGPLNRSWPGRACNLQWLPPIAREKVPETLVRYQVGLIPFREISGRLEYVERPLKFYEYIGAGLGVASTDVGALRSGMGDLASYGNTPEGFAAAISREVDRGAKRSAANCRELIGKYSWRNVMGIIVSRLEVLQALRNNREVKTSK